MHIIACVDERDGMLFNKRRVSSDQLLIPRILDLSAGRKLWISEYSKKLFSEANVEVVVSEMYLQFAGQGEYCFVETGDLLSYAESIESVTLYCWNRRYPADTYFPRELLREMNPVRVEEFPGHSHEKITMVRYER